MMTDPVADMLTRIRNANRNQFKTVSMPTSKLKVRIAEILKEEGYINDFQIQGEGVKAQLELQMKYVDEQCVITGIQRVSKPGLRRYVGKDAIPRVLGGLGVAILSTSKGVITGKEARRLSVGGELVCQVW
jgi:small subunit ribosomal protein S8